MKSARSLWRGLFWAAVVACGCAPRVVRPTESFARVEELKLRFAGPGRATLFLLLSCFPNREERVKSVDFELRMDGRYFAAGVSRVDTRLFPPAAHLELEVPLSFRPMPASEHPRTVRVDVHGGVRLHGGLWGDVRREFERQVSLSLAQVPQLEDQGALE